MAGGGPHGRRLILLLSAGRAAPLRGVGPAQPHTSPRFVEELPLPGERASVDCTGPNPANARDLGFSIPRQPAASHPHWSFSGRVFLLCRLVALTMLGQLRTGRAMRAMAQMKPTSSRAIAVTTLPVAFGGTPPCRSPSGGDNAGRA